MREIYNIYNNKVGYLQTPKCGGKTVFAWAYLLKHPNAINEEAQYFGEDAGNPKFQREFVLERFYPDIRFCIVRDPVDRFLSAYTYMIQMHNVLNKKISITEFIDTFDENVDTPEYKAIKIHTNLHRLNLGPDPKFFTHVFNLKNINGIKLILEKVSGKSLPDIHINGTVGKYEKPSITEEQSQWIKKRYEQDYDLFGKWM